MLSNLPLAPQDVSSIPPKSAEEVRVRYYFLRALSLQNTRDNTLYALNTYSLEASDQSVLHSYYRGISLSATSFTAGWDHVYR